jgi:hypothetical protein
LSLKQFGGGGDYLSTASIEEGLGGSILEPPQIYEKAFDGEKKTVCEFKMQIAGEPVPKIWSAGKFAVSLLVDTIGADPSQWKFPVKGHFEYRPWKTSRSSGRSAHFIPDGFNGGKALAKNVAVARTVMEDVPTSSGSASPTRVTLDCPMCADKFYGKDAETANALLVSHLDSHKKKTGEKKA